MVGEVAATAIFRARVVIETSTKVDLHANQSGLIYALFAAAYGESTNRDDVIPDGLMLDAPEQGRVAVAPGDPFAFGFTLLADGPDDAAIVVRSVVEGLRHLGRSARRSKGVLGGNFKVLAVEDLVAGRPVAQDGRLTAIPAERIEQDAALLRSQTTFTLRFTSPLRMTRSKPMRQKNHEFFDPDHFDVGLFVVRAIKRAAELGLGPAPDSSDFRAFKCTELERNRLVWMDFAYGSRTTDKNTYGAVGRITFRCHDATLLRPLVVGQYVRVGQATKFGQGAYRIEELGCDQYECRRAVGLVDLALQRLDLDEAAESYQLPAGVLRRAAKLLRTGRYTPEKVSHVPIMQSDGRQRVLAIPTRLDRALQRTMLAQLGPALDRLFEESSFAYRSGLGREKAAKRIREAYASGYRFGLRADFRRFFDSIDHTLLRERLGAYLNDQAATDALMSWVVSGSPFQGRGIPTGAPLSPLLANLFLDSFDEEVERDGAKLVRYADDFVIAYRTREEAATVFTLATSAAQALELALNEQKTQDVELGGPFEFLGYRFERRDRWIATATGEPRGLEDLGWTQTERKSPQRLWTALPGEGEPSTDDRAVVIVGPGATLIRVAQERLIVSSAGGNETSIPLERIIELVVIGSPTIAGNATRSLLTQNTRTLLSDTSGRIIGHLSAEDSSESPEAVAAQVDCWRDERWRVGLSRLLISAKLHNYAALADAEPGRATDTTTGPALRTLADRALRVDSLEELLGVEGSGAARWYGRFAERLPEWFRFGRRVAPNADDPGNAMLNLAMTALHRQLVLSIRMAGLVPTMGLLHEPRPGHAALASDLQEPFRHLMDRAVIAAARHLGPRDFTEDRDGPYSLKFSASAARRLVATVHETFAHTCVAAGKSDACTYRTHLLLSARSLRRHLLDRSSLFEVFRHP